jgi:hypothetical protein
MAFATVFRQNHLSRLDEMPQQAAKTGQPDLSIEPLEIPKKGIGCHNLFHE